MLGIANAELGSRYRLGKQIGAACVSLSLFFAAEGAAASGLRAAELSNAGFEDGEVLDRHPRVVGVWGGDRFDVVAAENGISPRGGERMARFDATAVSGASTQPASDVIQVVDLASLDGAIESVRVRAWCNRVAGEVGAADSCFGLHVTFHSAFPAKGTRVGDVNLASLYSDADVATWQPLSIEVRPPVGATHLRVAVRAIEDVVNDAEEPEFAGHYVDDVAVCFGCDGGECGACTEVDEPVTAPDFAAKTLQLGVADAFDSKSPLQRLKWREAGLRSAKDLAGSWISFHQVREMTLESLAHDAKRARELAPFGVFIVSVGWKGEAPDPDSLAPNHFAFVDSSAPPQMFPCIVDPAGVIVGGGITGRLVLAWGVGADDLEELSRCVPAITAAASEPGSRLRKAIAKRKWSSAIKAAGDAESERRVEGLIEAQLHWAEARAANRDPLSARNRLELLGSLPKASAAAPRLEAIEGRLDSPEARELLELQEELVEIAEDLHGAPMSGGDETLPEPAYDSLSERLRDIEPRLVPGAPTNMHRVITEALERISPHRACPGCGAPLHPGKGCD